MRIIIKTAYLLGSMSLLLFSQTISASAQQDAAPMSGEFMYWKYKIGVDDRIRYEYRHDFNLNKSVKDSGNGYGTGSLIFNRFKINGQARLVDENKKDILELLIEGLDGRIGTYQMKPPAQKSSLDLHQAYLDIYTILGSDFDIKLGRQEMKYGAGRLIASPSWANRIRSFDAAVLHYHHESAYFDLLYANDVKYDDDNLDASQYKEKLTGFYAGYQADKVSLLIEGYFLPQLMKGTTTDAKTNRYTAGMRIKGKVPGEILYDIESPYQFGRTNRKSIKAMALHADISRAFRDVLWEPNLALEYNYASGDKNPNDSDNNTFIPLYQSTHDPYGLMDFFRWQNMREIALRVDLSLSKKLKIIPQTNFFWLASTNDSWYDSTGAVLRARNTGGRRSHYVGQEVSVRANYDVNKNIKCETGYAHFFTGKMVAESGPNDDADWIYAQMSLKY